MARYLSFPLVTNPVTLKERAFAYLQARMPGWTPQEGNLDVWIIEANSTELAELTDVASRVPDTVFRYLGKSILGVSPVGAASATAATTWTMRDSAGYTIPVGTQVAIPNASGVPYPFVTVEDVTVPAGSTTTPVGGVTIVALNPGAASSGLGTGGGSVTLIDILDFVLSIVLTSSTANGQDAESDADYLNKLTGWIRLLSRTPILPQDFADLALTVPGVWRATVLDGYNPGDDTFSNERMVAIAAIDSAGNDVSAPVKAAVDALLQGLRETTFIVNTMSPTYTNVDVTATVKVLPGFTTASVDTAVTAAVTNYLQPYNWGLPLSPEATRDARAWINNNTVRRHELTAVINAVDGVDYIVGDPTIGLSGGAQTFADKTLAGRISLPRPGIIAITAT